MLDHDKREYLWSQKYRPKKIEDCILPDNLKSTFEGMASKERVPSLLLCGTAGTGKTTVAKALCDEVGADVRFINASNDNGIDTLRNEITKFVTTLSLEGKSKVVLLDEADSLTGSAQKALRAFVEDYSKNATFILTCNFRNKIIDPLQSRFTPIEFKIPTDEKPALASAFMKRVCAILDAEEVEYEKKVVAELISRYFPDFRRIINELQRYSSHGKIDSGILSVKGHESFKQLFSYLKAKKFNDVRKWIAENSDVDTEQLFRELYDNAVTMVEPRTIPNLILILAKYQYQDAFVADKEINLMAAMVEVMGEVSWK